MAHLFDKFTLKSVTLKNRIVGVADVPVLGR